MASIYAKSLRTDFGRRAINPRIVIGAMIIKHKRGDIMGESLSWFVNALIFFIAWILIPGIMLGIVIVSRSLSKRSTDQEASVSARAGWWAGLVLFSMYFIYNISSFQIPDVLIDKSLTLHWFGTISGIIIGFVLLWGLIKLVESRVLGFLTLLLTFSGTSALYSYIFIRSFNYFLLSATLGVSFGTLIHIIIFPKSVKNIWVFKTK